MRFAVALAAVTGERIRGLDPGFHSNSFISRKSSRSNHLDGETPEAVGALSNLRWLILFDNQLTPIPDAMAQLSTRVAISAPTISGGSPRD